MQNLFGKDIGQNEPECTNNPIKEFISLSSKCYSYICKNDIENNKNKLKKKRTGLLNVAEQRHVKQRGPFQGPFSSFLPFSPISEESEQKGEKKKTGLGKKD